MLSLQSRTAGSSSSEPPRRIFVRGQLAADVLEPVFRLEALEDHAVIDLLRRALADWDRRGTEGRVPQ